MGSTVNLALQQRFSYTAMESLVTVLLLMQIIAPQSADIISFKKQKKHENKHAPGEPDRGNTAKQACYFQDATLAESGQEKGGKGRNEGDSETRTAQGYKYLMCYYFSINIKPIKTCSIDEVYF